mmetsp:Transcript_88938/g.269719  ORF Transcript_88938/g.269719 Transcript_88938/m.269719 type:complete len:132 (+) Transcript_88938:82-477(+)
MAPLPTILSLLALSLPLQAAGALRGPAGSSPATNLGQAPLHDEMRSMMADDGADEAMDSKGRFLQMGAELDDGEDAAYMQDSAQSLSSALGPRWVGSELEADARRKTDALLNGIAGQRTLGSLNSLMRALP